MNTLEKESLVLIREGNRLEPFSLEKNTVGFCARCESELQSLAYHQSASGWLVSARCGNEHLTLMAYDRDWNWLGDEDLQISAEQTAVSSLPKEKLEAVFTAAEIRDMIACQQGLPYTRQNIYRARTKYEKFEKLFGVKIDI